MANHDEALAIARRIGERDLEAEVEENLGHAHLDRGEMAEALVHHRRARELAQDVGDSYRIISTLNSLGEALALAGHPDDAARQFRRARDTAAGEVGQRARAEAGLRSVLQHPDGRVYYTRTVSAP